MLALAYGQPPMAFDDWDVALVEKEIEIYTAIRNDGEVPLTRNELAFGIGLAFKGD